MIYRLALISFLAVFVSSCSGMNSSKTPPAINDDIIPPAVKANEPPAVVKATKVALECREDSTTTVDSTSYGKKEPIKTVKSSSTEMYLINLLDNKVSRYAPARITEMKDVSIAPKFIKFKTSGKIPIEYSINRETLEITSFSNISDFSRKDEATYYVIEGKGVGVCKKITYPELNSSKNQI